MDVDEVSGEGEITGKRMFHAEGGLLRIGVLEIRRGAESDGIRWQRGFAIAKAKLRQVRRRNARCRLATQDLALGKQCLEYGRRVERRVSGKTVQRNNGRGHRVSVGAEHRRGCIYIEDDRREVD